MTRKHFVAVARTIAEQLDGATKEEARKVREIADSLCSVFASQNSRFSRATFLSACGFDGFA